MDLAPGSIIAGRYRVDQRVGAGGMGEVWVGEHLAIGMRVAIKTLLEAAAYDHEVVARFRREANLLGRIRSEHVARVVDFIEDPHVGLVLVMEFIEGSALSKILHQRRLSVEEAIDVGCDVVDALCVLHRAHVIHRDMKPGNVIMEPQANGKLRAIVVDFGMGRIAAGAGEDLEQTNLTRADMALGTLEYMAPEQILNSRDVTAGSDLYAVGAMLYRAVAGRHIFGDAQDAELARAKLMTDAPQLQTGRNDRISQGFVNVVMRAVQRRPQQRYQKSDDMLNELRALQDAVRAQAFEHSAAKHLLGPMSMPQPSVQQPQQQQYAQQPQQQQYAQQQQPQHPGYPATQTPLPQQQQQHAQQQQYAQQQQAAMQAGQERQSISGPVSGQSGSTSVAAPISVPVANQRRGVSVGAVVAIILASILVAAGVFAFLLRDKLGLSGGAPAPAATPAAAASVAAQPPAPPPAQPAPTAAPTPAASASEEPLDVEAAPAPAPTPSVKAPVGGSLNKPLGAPTGTAPAPSNKAPTVKTIQF